MPHLSCVREGPSIKRQASSCPTIKENGAPWWKPLGVWRSGGVIGGRLKWYAGLGVDAVCLCEVYVLGEGR